MVLAYPSLGHAKRPRVHTKKEHLLVGLTVFVYIVLVRFPGIIQRVINMVDRFTECKVLQAETLFSFYVEKLLSQAVPLQEVCRTL